MLPFKQEQLEEIIYNCIKKWALKEQKTIDYQNGSTNSSVAYEEKVPSGLKHCNGSFPLTSASPENKNNTLSSNLNTSGELKGASGSLESNAESMSKINNEKWLLVEYGNNTKGVIHLRYVLNKENVNFQPGRSITISKRGEQQLVTLIARSDERALLEQIIDNENAGPSAAPEEPFDYSSASSWEPDDDDDVSDSEVECKRRKFCEKVKIKFNKKNRRVLKPFNRVNAVKRPAASQNPREVGLRKYSRKRTHDLIEEREENNNNDEIVNNEDPQMVNLELQVNQLIDIKNALCKVVGVCGDMKEVTLEHLYKKIKKARKNIAPNAAAAAAAPAEIEIQDNEEFNRSDDNVLISNKFLKKEEHKDDEWVPIGSGKTLIKKDNYRKVKWTSYTIATRTLLLALFPRQTLATHSLTGKKSPAFQNKPAKMCLDPKIIADIIIEVMERFDVRENLVRSIITTKCADEAKMYRTRMQREQSMSPMNKKVKSQELAVEQKASIKLQEVAIELQEPSNKVQKMAKEPQETADEPQETANQPQETANEPIKLAKFEGKTE